MTKLINAYKIINCIINKLNILPKATLEQVRLAAINLLSANKTIEEAELPAELVEAVRELARSTFGMVSSQSQAGEATPAEQNPAGQKPLELSTKIQAPLENAEKLIRKVTVNYKMGLEAMIAAGKYDWVNGNITKANFPVWKRDSSEEVELRLVHLGHEVTTDQALSELDCMGLRLATLPELLALGAAHFDLQRESWIVALGSEWRLPGGDLFFPVLDVVGSVRGLLLDFDDPASPWGAGCRFAAVRK